MKKDLFKLFACLLFWCVFFYLCALLSGCHALVVADKLYYQGSIGKKNPDKVEVNDSTFISVSNDRD